MAVHILIADDEEDLVFLLQSKFKKRLRSGEWVFYTASDGLEALALLEKTPEIELVLTDLNMPNMDGLAMLEQIQQMDRSVQTIVVTAYSDMSNIRVAMNRGAYDFIVKPINLADLEATLLKTLEYIGFLKEVALAQEELTQTKSELDFSKELAQLKSQFFANISHEFRTPLTLILGPLQDILCGELGNVPAEMQAALSIMHKHARRLRKLIDQLLDVARLEAGKLSLHVVQTGWEQFVAEQTQAFKAATDQAGITLEIRHEQAGTSIYLDPDLFEKIFANLLSNALKWTPEGGKIRVMTGVASDMAFFQIRDNGKGIPAEALPHIFERFYQVDTSASQTKGTGIGLSLTKELVNLHKGRITVESESGFGSTFTVFVPLGDMHFEKEALKPIKQPAPVIFDEITAAESFEDEGREEGRETVLLVEDQTDIRSYVRGLLARYYRVVEAPNGREGLNLLKTELPALVISDVMMPEMDGFQFCKAIKSDATFNDVPVILLTAKAEEDDRLEGLGFGADDYIVKPFNANELLVRVENLIGIRKLLRNKYAPGFVMQASDVSVPSADEAFLSAVQTEIEKEMGNPNFDVAQLADAVALSPRQLRRRLRELTGLSTSGLVRSLRLQRAAQLLEQNAGSVSEIAYRVGFQQVKYFSRLFKQVYGIKPSDYGR